MLTNGKDSLRFPMTPDEATRVLAPYMWELERREVHEFDTIYFFPLAERKKEKEKTHRSKDANTYGILNEETNNGFDND